MKDCKKLKALTNKETGQKLYLVLVSDNKTVQNKVTVDNIKADVQEAPVLTRVPRTKRFNYPTQY